MWRENHSGSCILTRKKKVAFCALLAKPGAPKGSVAGANKLTVVLRLTSPLKEANDVSYQGQNDQTRSVEELSRRNCLSVQQRKNVHTAGSCSFARIAPAEENCGLQI